MKEITDEYLLSLVQKEEYVVMGCKFLICGLNTKNGLLVSSDPFYVGSGNFDKAKETTKKNAISKLQTKNKYGIYCLSPLYFHIIFFEKRLANYLANPSPLYIFFIISLTGISCI